MKLSEILVLKGGDPDQTYKDAINSFIQQINAKTSRSAKQMPPGSNAVVIDTKSSNSFVWRVWMDDPGFERFLGYVKNNAGSEHLPKILSRVRTEAVTFSRLVKGKTVKILKLEKLSALEKGPLFDAVESMGEMSKSDLNDVNSISSLAEKLELPRAPNSTLEQMKAVVMANENLFLTMMDLIKHHNANDINNSNVMMRGNVPVITDPFSN